MSPAEKGMTPSESVVPVRGWHGMTARNHKRYSPDDWKTWGQLGGKVTLVDVAIGSPAWRAELRDRTWIVSLNKRTFDAFEATAAPVGTVVRVEAFRPDLGNLYPNLTLVERPKAKRAPRRQNRMKVPIAACGRPISRIDRPKWLSRLDEKAWLSCSARVIGSFLCNRAINDNGWTDVWSYKRIARKLGLSEDTVQRGTKELNRAGLCDIRSGRRARRENRYTLTWPQDEGVESCPSQHPNTKR